VLVLWGIICSERSPGHGKKGRGSGEGKEPVKPEVSIRRSFDGRIERRRCVPWKKGRLRQRGDQVFSGQSACYKIEAGELRYAEYEDLMQGENFSKTSLLLRGGTPPLNLKNRSQRGARDPIVIKGRPRKKKNTASEKRGTGQAVPPRRTACCVKGADGGKPNPEGREQKKLRQHVRGLRGGL